MKSYIHKDKRPHIPSKEEAGYEIASDQVQEAGEAYLKLPKNPIVHRGQDPELWWLNKYGNDNRDELLKVDIRSLYRHEHISPEVIMQSLYKLKETKHPVQLSLNEMFGNALDMDEEEKVAGYYHHEDGWSNRLIQGDSLLTMASLLEREGMAGKVQTIYFDPPYGIKYGGNWQMKLNSRDVKDGNDEHLSGEPEMIKAFRDTWADGIHSYLGYLRDRLLVAKELLTESGSCFLQISDENVHLVRNLMDEVFGSENFVSLITIQKTGGQTNQTLTRVTDYLVWYCKNNEQLKFRRLFEYKNPEDYQDYCGIEYKDGRREMLSFNEALGKYASGEGRLFRYVTVTSQTGSESTRAPFEFSGNKYTPGGSRGWSTTIQGMNNLARINRLYGRKNDLVMIRYFDDLIVEDLKNIWKGVNLSSRSEDKLYVVQTSIKIIQRCILMTTDPGDLVLDPTCGSGTTAFVAEQWGRRWITIDTSRIALNIAKTRLMTAVFPYYHLYADSLVKRDEKDGKIKKTIASKQEHECTGDVRQGFVYEEVPHITLKSLANNEPADTETLFDKPYEDKSKLRVAGPFTVETLQSFNPVSPEELDAQYNHDENFEDRIFDHLKSAGIMNGIKNERAIFKRIEKLNSEYLHARGYYDAGGVEKTAYIHIGPKFGSVSKMAVSAAIKECRQRPDADWMVILGFAFESNISNDSVTSSMGSFEVTKARMHDDLMQDGLLKKPKNVGSFVTIGEPDVVLRPISSPGGGGQEGAMVAEIRGIDIYDPIKDEVKPRDLHDIAYWMVDDDYDGSNFIVKQVFFVGGDKDEFDKWHKGLSDLTESRNKRKKQVQQTLQIEIDEEAFDRLYGHVSHPIPHQKGKKIAVRVISQFGEESTKVLVM